MGNSAAYGYISAIRAIEDAGLTDDMLKDINTGLVVGSGGLSESHSLRLLISCVREV